VTRAQVKDTSRALKAAVTRAQVKDTSRALKALARGSAFALLPVDLLTFF